MQFCHKVHEAHGLARTQCHHELLGRNVWRQGQPVQKGWACHGLRPQVRTQDLKDALHRQCKGCHLRLKQQRRRAGPVTCRECHR